jgi:DNA-binding GntR family transcriptional regulator
MRKPQHSLAEHAFEHLKQDILRCHFRPGQILNEADLASRYKMSKTPIREAINLLRRDGFVQVLPRRGVLVRSIELQDVQNTFLLRLLLEPEAAALAATRATTDQLKRISELGEALARSEAKSGVHERLELHRTLHEAIAQASGVRDLVPMIRSLHEKVEWFYNYERRTDLHQSSDLEHLELSRAIVAGDADRARSLIAESIRSSREHLLESLIREPRLSVVPTATRPA